MWPAVSNGFKLHLLDETVVARKKALNVQRRICARGKDSLIYVFE